MDEQEFQKYVEQIARKRGIPKETIIKDIETCIEESFRKVHSGKDAEAIKQWEEIPAAGDMPTACEFLSYVAEMVRKELDQQEEGSIMEMIK